MVTKLTGDVNGSSFARDERNLSLEQTAVGPRSPMRVHIRTPTESPSQTAMSRHFSPSGNHTSATATKVRNIAFFSIFFVLMLTHNLKFLVSIIVHLHYMRQF